MAKVRVQDDDLVVELVGLEKLWALKSSLTIPLRHLRGAAQDPRIASRRAGIKVGGIRLPGVITAGTFYENGEKTFWNVHELRDALVIELRDETYARLIIEVDDPRTTARLVQAAIDNR